MPAGPGSDEGWRRTPDVRDLRLGAVVGDMWSGGMNTRSEGAIPDENSKEGSSGPECGLGLGCFPIRSFDYMRKTLGILALCALASVASGYRGPAIPLTITINSFTIAPDPAVVGATTTFTVNATGTVGGLSYQWTFGDGSTISFSPLNSTVTHQYTQPGHYTVTVEVQEPQIPPAAPLLVSQDMLLQVHYPLKTPRPTHSSTIVLDSTRSKVWCVNIDSDTVARVDVATHVKDREVSVGQTPRSIAQAGDGTIWVVSQQHPSISVIHPDTAALLHVVPLPHGSLPYGIAMSPDGQSAFVTLQGTGGVRKFNVASRTQVAAGTEPSKARGVAVTSDGRVLVT
ncbi:MAG: PKD domain-containing protein, partial [Planctomycetota bacterium]